MYNKHGLECRSLFTDEPLSVKFVPRFIADIQALNILMSSVSLPQVYVRGPRIFHAKYSFGNASGGGFSSSMFTQSHDSELDTRFGVWNEDESEHSFNWREVTNLVESVEELSTSLTGAEVFLFTDNAVSSAVFYKGNSTSLLLFNLMLRLRKVQMNGLIKIWLIHVSGKRMI